MVRIAPALALAVVAACYSPSYRECAIGCTQDVGCPDGLSCIQGTCRSSPTAVCDVQRDGGSDTADADTCVPTGWDYMPANAQGCAYQNGTVAWDVPASVMINTGDANGLVSFNPPNGAPPHVIVPQPLGPELLVITVADFTIESAGIVTVVGSRPLAIVANGAVRVLGSLEAGADLATPGPGAGLADCLGSAGGAAADAVGNPGGGGGGGGTFGTTSIGGKGANGGLGDPNVAGGSGGGSSGATLIPLRGGCPGGKGGDAAGNLGGAPGAAGGAIELAARTTLTVSGFVHAGGGGGRNSGNMKPGGGGGGSGGAIILEGTSVTVSGSVCANGGGGGGSGMVTVPVTAQNGICAAQANGGSNGGASNSPGGSGATDTFNATAGASGVSTSNYGGGGGGGGVGKIRTHGSFSTTGQVTPTADTTL